MFKYSKNNNPKRYISIKNLSTSLKYCNINILVILIFLLDIKIINIKGV